MAGIGAFLPNSQNQRNGMGRWIMLGVIVFVAGAFIGGYNFFSSAFVSRTEFERTLQQSAGFVTRREFDEVRSEQARRTPLVFGQFQALQTELADLRRRVTELEGLQRSRK